MGSLKGNQTTTTSTAPPPQVASAYGNIMGAAGNAASQPFVPYGGPVVAGFSPDQMAAFQGIENSTGVAQPYINAAASYAGAGASPITPGAISQYFNPYVGQVGAATTAELGDLFAQQNQQVVGNAIHAGAWGGDRAAIAQSELAKQQILGAAPTLAGINTQGYNTALSAAQQDALRAGQAAYTFGQLGQEQQGTTLTGLQSLLGAGGMQQQLAQQYLNVPMQNYYTSLAYPFQSLGWLAGIDTSVGSQLGGTSQTTGPPPNALAQMLGLGVAGAGTAGNLGWKPFASKRGGRVLHRDAGGSTTMMPYTGPQPLSGIKTAFSVPYVPLKYGAGPPHPPGMSSNASSAFDPSKMANMGLSMSKAGASGSTAAGGGAGDLLEPAEAAAVPMEAAGDAAAVGGSDALAAALPFLLLRRGGRAHLAGIGAPILLHRHAGGGGVGPEDAGLGFAGIDVDSLRDPGQDLPTFFESGDPEVVYGGPQPTRVAGPSAVTYGAGTGRAPVHLDTAGVGVPTDVPSSFDAALGTPAAFGDRFVGDETPVVSRPGLASAINAKMNPDFPAAVPGRPAADRSLDVPAVAPPAQVPVASAAPPPPLPPPGYAPQRTAPQGIDLSAVRPTADDSGFLGIKGVPSSVSTPLMAAGFAMMASRSPFLGQAVGEGGLAGIQTFEAQQSQAFKQKTEQEKIQLMSQKLSAIADRQAATLAETTRHHGAVEQQGRFADAGTYMGPDGAARPLVRETKTGRVMDGITLEPIDPKSTVLPKGAQQMVPLTQEQLTAVGWGPKEIATAGATYNLTGQMPSNLGRQGYQIKGAIMRAANDQWETAGKSPEDRVRQWQDTKASQLGLTRFTSGKQGDVVRSLGVAVDHLGTLRRLGDALNNGDTQLFNKIANWWAKQSGRPEPTNLQSAAMIIGTEVEKAIGAAGGGTAGERIDIANHLASLANSPAQFNGAIDGTVRPLLAGQVRGLRNQWEVATKRPGGDFDQMLTPAAREFLGVSGHAEPAPPVGGAPAATPATPAAPPRTLRAPTTGEIQSARDAISKGASPAAVRQRLEQGGVSAAGL